MTNDNQTALESITDAYNASQTKVHVTLENQNGYNEMIDKYTAVEPGHRARCWRSSPSTPCN